MNNDLPLSWTEYNSGTPNSSCNNGRPIYETTKNESTAEGKALPLALCVSTALRG